MKKILLGLCLLLSTTTYGIDVKISQLPLGAASTSGSADSFPFVSSALNITKRMTLWDIVNIPTLSSTFAPKANPTFTGVVTAPSFVGQLTGNATTASALAADPTDCSANQYANAIAANGNLTCAQPAFSQVSGTLGVSQGGTGLNSGTAGGILSFTGSTALASSLAGSTGQILRSAGTASPTWSTATYPASTTANQILYSSATNTVGQITAANTSALVTSSGGVPSLTSGGTPNRVLRTDGTTVSFAQVAAGTDISGTLGVSNGGTGAGTLAAHGVVIGNTTSAVNVTSAGTAGQVLTSNGASADPTFQASSGTNYSVAAKSGIYSILTTDTAILGDATSAGFTMTLPTPSGNTGKYYVFKKTDSSFNAVTVTHNASETIDGASAITLNTQYESAMMFTDGTNWYLSSHSIPSVWTSYTPTFTGFGTVTVQTFWWRRVGDSIEIKGRFTSGTVTATEARVSLPSGLTSSSSSKINGTLELAGQVSRNTDSADTIYAMLIEPSVTYVTFGSVAAGTNFGTAALTKLNGSGFLTSGDNISLWAKLPISGWGG